MKIKYNYFYTRVQEKKVCVTNRDMDTSKCRKDIFPSKNGATKFLQKRLNEGYELVDARTFRKLLV